MKGKHKKVKEWCKGCDKELVEVGKKCTQCDHVNDNKLHKPHSSELINDYYDLISNEKSTIMQIDKQKTGNKIIRECQRAFGMGIKVDDFWNVVLTDKDFKDACAFCGIEPIYLSATKSNTHESK